MNIEAEDPIILFVCTGNIFRSFLAEHLFRDAHGDSYHVVSAGIQPAYGDEPRGRVTDFLEDHGVSYSTEEAATQITREHVAAADYAVAMAEDHQQYINNHYDVSLPLFNDVIGGAGSIPDVDDVDITADEHVERIGEHLHDNIEVFCEAIEKARVTLPESYTRFQALLNGSTHKNGTEFRVIASTENAVAFHSVDIPDGDHDHVLVIPRRRYVYYHNIPEDIASEMTWLAQRIGAALMSENDGYNVLLNNEAAAGQCVYHAHMHVVGRFEEDTIEMEGWDHVAADDEAYAERSNRIQADLNPDHF